MNPGTMSSGGGGYTEFRLKFDTKTRQHKGYGFVEYRDRDVAISAIRNLSGGGGFAVGVKGEL